MSFWDNHPPQGDFPPMFPPANTGGWHPGQWIEGVITETRSYTFDGDDKATPIIHLRTDDGGEFSVGCGAIRLNALMFSLRPSVGNRVRITCTGKEGKSLNFEVLVLDGQAPAAAPAPAPAAAQPVYTPPPAPAAPAPAPAPAYAPPAAPAPAYAPPPAPAPAAPAPVAPPTY